MPRTTSDSSNATPERLSVPDVTESEWRELLEAFERGACVEDGQTVTELCEAMGLDPDRDASRDRIKIPLRRAIRAGRVVVGKGRRPRLDGILVTVSTYRVVEGDE